MHAFIIVIHICYLIWISCESQPSVWWSNTSHDTGTRDTGQAGMHALPYDVARRVAEAVARSSLRLSCAVMTYFFMVGAKLQPNRTASQTHGEFLK